VCLLQCSPAVLFTLYTKETHMDLYRDIIFPYLTQNGEDAEKAHKRAERMLRLPFAPMLCRLIARNKPKYPIRELGLTFNSPVGFAAGLDKDARIIPALAPFFGFGTIGTITPKPQSGNERPRLFRLDEDRGIINRMGFNSAGADVVARNLKKARLCVGHTFPIGISLGKMKDTPNERAAEDYIHVLARTRAYVDYIEVNVSSPNTPGLRNLQHKQELYRLLREIRDAERTLAKRTETRKLASLVKVSPDLTINELDEVIGVCVDLKIDGIVAGNTTTERDGITSSLKNENGGASGPFLFDRTCDFVSHIAHHAPNLTIVACGGISSSDQAAKVLDLGATLVQIYTGFIYQGWRLPLDITRHLAAQ
jgi:dihydroorotate dehydrogenase